ncbi:MAG: hypothetical protein KGY99_06090 [Phycisphaerae bacterium]|nr:hypothetical protein [Phycisphaerae bacterium]
MTRYGRIETVAFGGTQLPLVLSVRVCRRGEARCAGGQIDRFATNVEFAASRVEVEVRLRGTATAETLTLGTVGTLTFAVAAMSGDEPGRVVTIAGAVLAAVEAAYEQSSAAVAVLRFTAESVGGDADPHHAEDAA